MWRPDTSVVKQIVKEFRIAVTAGIVVAISSWWFFGKDFVTTYSSTFLFVFFLTAAYVRISRQQSTEGLLERVEASVSDLNSNVMPTILAEIKALKESVPNAEFGARLAKLEAAVNSANTQVETANTAITEVRGQIIGVGATGMVGEIGGHGFKIRWPEAPPKKD